VEARCADGPTQQPSRVLVLVYPEHATAEVVYEKIRAMDKDGRIKVVDAALVTADERGELTVISTHRHATKSFAKAAAGGLLIGAALSLPIIGLALAGGAVGIGATSPTSKEQEFADRLQTIKKPSHSAVLSPEPRHGRPTDDRRAGRTAARNRS
jgi:uncharacterized membrane protein